MKIDQKLAKLRKHVALQDSLIEALYLELEHCIPLVDKEWDKLMARHAEEHARIWGFPVAENQSELLFNELFEDVPCETSGARPRNVVED